MAADPGAMAAHFSNVDVYFNTSGSGCYEDSYVSHVRLQLVTIGGGVGRF